jgi:hypothetical protein
MQIDESEGQYEKAEFSIDRSFDRDSNVTVESAAHPKKQLLPIFWTEEGKQIHESAGQRENANCSIDWSAEPGPKVTECRT